MRRVDPDALYQFVSSYWGRADADAICPKVAEPNHPPDIPDSSTECDPYCMAGSVPCRKCRERARAVAEPEQPKPYDYHADFEYRPEYDIVAYRCRHCGGMCFGEPDARHNCPKQPTPSEPGPMGDDSYGNNDTRCGPDPELVIDEAKPSPAATDNRHLTSDELAYAHRYGGGRGIAVAQLAKADAAAKPVIDEAKPSPAATDDRRLTVGEMNDAFLSRPGTQAAIRAVADAQLAKAKVTISEAEVLQILGWSNTTSRPSDRARAICDLLRRRGVEVTP